MPTAPLNCVSAVIVALRCQFQLFLIEKVHLDDLDLYVVTSAVIATSVLL